jgi:2-succinyl-5-enolpyruvyl-6-hydroxy-3-cyclohexene-1-carboxylate synthase
MAAGHRVNYPNLNYALAGTLLAQLRHCGCRRVVISPGSRSTPLAHVALELGAFDSYVLTDERSAGFFALGLSRADQLPAILICTSGTAAANYFPAVIEAAQGMVPLLVLTADRPARLRHTGAPQTIDQYELYGRYPRLFAETSPATEPTALAHARDLALLAYQAATTLPWGPAHLNIPLDEPLAPVADAQHPVHAELPELLAPYPPVVVPDRLSARAREALRDSLCGLIVAGPDAAHDEREARAIHGLARQLGWPLFADVLSGLRYAGAPVIAGYDILLRNDGLQQLAPDFVLSVGASPTSRMLNQWLDQQRDVFTLRVQPHAIVQDPAGRATETLITDRAAYCEALSATIHASRDSLLLDPFQQAAGRLNSLVSAWRPDADAAAELAYVAELLGALAAETRLVLANSMSVRYADLLAGIRGEAVSMFGMRGANGIDGTLAHAAGIAAASVRPTVLLTGDLAFLHDLNGLNAVRKYARNLTIVLLHNDGGGIFHYLSVNGTTAHFETIHGTPHGLNLRAAADLFDLEWEVAATPSLLARLLNRPSTHPRIIEVESQRAANFARHQEIVNRLAAAVLG